MQLAEADHYLFFTVFVVFVISKETKRIAILTLDDDDKWHRTV